MKGTLAQELRSMIKGEVLEGATMRELTSFRIGGEAPLLVRPSSKEETIRVLQFFQSRGVPWKVLGRGTNLLVDDRGIPWAVVDLRWANRKLEVKGRAVSAGAGVLLGELLHFCATKGLSGLEPLAGIPGTVGGAIRRNAGSGGIEICSRVRSLSIIGPKGVEERRGPLSYSYREGPLSPGEVLWEAVFELEEDDPEDIRGRLSSFIEGRRRRQPLDMPSAGCIFKNPPEGPAGRLIEEAGLKGMRRGGAAVSEIHANFIVNLGGATFADVSGLIEDVRERVAQVHGVELELEVEVWS